MLNLFSDEFLMQVKDKVDADDKQKDDDDSAIEESEATPTIGRSESSCLAGDSNHCRYIEAFNYFPWDAIS